MLGTDRKEKRDLDVKGTDVGLVYNESRHLCDQRSPEIFTPKFLI